MSVLIGCEYSAVERLAFEKVGLDTWSCDLLDTDVPGKHIKGDLHDIINNGWQMAVLHPPCQYLCNSGVRWLFNKDKTINSERWAKMEAAAEFFKFCLNAPIPRIAVENPVMHKYAMQIIGVKPTQTIQPWMFGEDASKRTCLWLKGLPKLKPTNVIIKEHYSNQTASGQNKIGPSPDRWKIRSKSYQGIADAMAFQWGKVKDLTSWIPAASAGILNSRNTKITDFEESGRLTSPASSHSNTLYSDYINNLPSICGLRG